MVNINIFVGLSRDWMGVKFCLCVFVGPIVSWGRVNTIARKYRDNPGKCLFVCVCVFFVQWFVPHKNHPLGAVASSFKSGFKTSDTPDKMLKPIHELCVQSLC